MASIKTNAITTDTVTAFVRGAPRNQGCPGGAPVFARLAAMVSSRVSKSSAFRRWCDAVASRVSPLVTLPVAECRRSSRKIGKARAVHVNTGDEQTYGKSVRRAYDARVLIISAHSPLNGDFLTHSHSGTPPPASKPICLSLTPPCRLHALYPWPAARGKQYPSSYSVRQGLDSSTQHAKTLPGTLTSWLLSSMIPW